MFNQAHPERKLELMVSTLQKLAILLFGADYQNHARWISILIRDLKGVPSQKV